MIPDLGKYAFEVTAAYIVSLMMLAALVAFYLWRGAKIRRQLAEVEARQVRKDA